MTDPRDLDLRPIRHDQEHAQIVKPDDRAAEQVERRRVDPVGVFEDREHRLPAGQDRS